MKINISKSVLSVFLAAATLVSCQSEPEVGSTLYPTIEENYSSKAYLYTGSSTGNYITLPVTKSPTSLTLTNDSALVYVKLSSPTDKDVTVTVAATTEGINTLDNKEIMTADAVKLNKTSFTISKGQQTATEPLVIKLQDSDALKKVTNQKNGVIAITINSVNGANTASTYNKVLVATNFSYDYINPSGELDYTKALNLNAYEMSTNLYGVTAKKLNDNNTSTYVYQYVHRKPEFIMTFKNETKLSAISILSTFTQYNYGVKQVEIFTSIDGTTWTGQGTITASTNYDDSTPFPIVFYEPVTCKYAKIKILSSFDTGTSPRFAISEIWGFE